MGDRTTPMKFGPEWLRNLSREPTSSGSQPSGGGAQSSTPASRAANLAATATATTNNPPNTSKVLLAKLRYGREEILALYDRQTAEAPQQLKSVELLYHPRGKPPYALNNNFEDDTRDMRNNPAMGGMGPTDRYGLARGRGMSLGEGRGRATISEGRSRGRGFVRQTSLGSDTFRTPSWHNGGQRTYPGAPEDDPNPSRGLWNTGNGSNLLPIRANMEVAEWASKMAYRKNRQNHTNWRQQQNRDEGEEWRSSEGQRRGQEKWEREWPERSNQDKPWTSNRRQWGGDNNDDALPEWAVENSEACAGTFDSSGAFHGYSIDDSDLPKTQESYPLARSHTHGGVPRSRTAEEGSEEWWASEKAKKLSAKRFDATKSNEENDGGNATSATNTGANTNTVPTRNESKAEIIRSAIHEDPTHDYGFELQDEAAALPVKPKQEHEEDKPKDRKYHGNTQPSAQQRIDMLLRADKPDTTTERKDHTSVMMAINTNRLRLRHQNIGSPTNEPTKKKSVLEMMVEQQRIKESQQRQQEKESKLVDDMLDMHISEELQSQLLNSTTQAATMVNPVTSMANKLSSPVMKMRMSNPSNQAMGVKQQKTNTMSTPGHQQGTMMRPILGISNSMLNASLGLPVGPSSNISMPPPLIQNPGMLSSSHQGVGGGNMQGSLQGMQTGLTGNMQVGGLQTGLQVPGIQGNSFKPGGGIPGNMQPNIQSSGIHNSNFQSGSGMPGSRMPGSGMPGSGMPGSGMAGSGMAGSGMAGSGMPGSGIPGSGMPGSGMLGSVMSASGMPGFQGNNSLFMQGASNNMQNPNDMSNHGQQNMYQMHGHGMQQPQPQSSFNRTTIFSNMMQPVPNGFIPNIPLMDQWFYEDPKKNIQGPFTTNEMNCWYRAGFFNSELMVRRACESNLRPLATYGPMPFGAPLQEAMTPAYTIRFYPPATPLGMGNTQQAGLGPDVESLWSQPTTNDLMWLQQRSTSREDDNSRVNNLSMYFWDQPSGMSNALLPEGITKEMKTEDEILAQMRAAQGEPAAQDLTFMTDVVNPEDAFTAGTNIAPNLEELQKLIGSDIHVGAGHRATTAAADADPTRTIHGPRLAMPEKISEHVDPVPEVSAKPQLSTKAVEVKTTKQPVKVEEKTSKNKEITVTKAKTKKQKEDKKEDAEVKDGDCKTTERRSEEPSQPTKKEDKANKKELEKEKKEWLKDGFTIVKGAEKKDSKKKEKEEARAAEEAEKKRKEDEKRALLEAEKNRAPEPVTRRQQLETGQVQKQVLQPVEPAPKKAPWSAQCASRDGPALADIQRLEREKKLEQMKEQQLMMQAIAQQQAEAAQREQQEMQAGQLGWAKKKQPNNSPPGQTLAEIQAEARKQAAAMSAAASAAAREEAQAALPPPANVAPWGATNGGGFWDSPACATPLSASERSSEAPLLKTTEPKPKKKVTVMTPPKKDTTPSADFETWCTNVLSNWRDAANIDIPTFVAFLRDIESPYEVKDYVKCYLGDTKDSNDFSRQFLERRSRLLRVGMVTPSDDLCSPAAAINPRTNSGSDYTEVKAKGIKKTKKNKMLKIDARILGFSVTASEDRINVGDIDSV